MAPTLVSRDGDCTTWKISNTLDWVHKNDLHVHVGQRDSSRLVFVCSFVTWLGMGVFGLVQTAVLTSYIDEEEVGYM
jgi:hypothetical protein